MQTAELTRALVGRGIVPIVVGGVAMRFYESPRVTQDLALAIRTLDVDDTIDLMYDLSYLLVTGVDAEAARLAANRHAAQRWLAVENPGSLSFVAAPTDVRGATEAPGEGVSAEEPPPDHRMVNHTSIEIESQVDFLYELAVPYPRLKSRSREIDVSGTTLLVASPADLIALKEARSDRSADDEADIAFLKGLLQGGDAPGARG